MNSEFELKFDIKTNLDNMENILQVINENIGKEFNAINKGETDMVVTATIKKINNHDVDIEERLDNINQQINKLSDKGKISDGSHTFDELYHHRMILFAVICNSHPQRAWKSWKHSDGSMFDNYFIVGISTPEGNYSYHYHEDNWDYFDVKELEFAPEWDGHLPRDINRLFSLL